MVPGWGTISGSFLQFSMNSNKSLTCNAIIKSGLPIELANIVFLYKKEFEMFDKNYLDCCRNLYELRNTSLVLQNGLPYLGGLDREIHVGFIKWIDETTIFSNFGLRMLIAHEGFPKLFGEVAEFQDRIAKRQDYCDEMMRIHPYLEMVVSKAKQLPFPGVSSVAGVPYSVVSYSVVPKS